MTTTQYIETINDRNNRLSLNAFIVNGFTGGCFTNLEEAIADNADSDLEILKTIGGDNTEYTNQQL